MTVWFDRSPLSSDVGELSNPAEQCSNNLLPFSFIISTCDWFNQNILLWLVDYLLGLNFLIDKDTYCSEAPGPTQVIIRDSALHRHLDWQTCGQECLLDCLRELASGVEDEEISHFSEYFVNKTSREFEYLMMKHFGIYKCLKLNQRSLNVLWCFLSWFFLSWSS